MVAARLRPRHRLSDWHRSPSVRKSGRECRLGGRSWSEAGFLLEESGWPKIRDFLAFERDSISEIAAEKEGGSNKTQQNDFKKLTFLSSWIALLIGENCINCIILLRASTKLRA